MKIKAIKFLKISRPDQNPDIDMDFESLRRDEVKRYFEHKYGSDRVCSIGTYNGMKLKSAVKDFSRIDGLQFSYVNFITSLIGKQLKYEWADLFKYAMDNKEFREYLENNKDIINMMKPVLNQAKSAGMHASAIIVVPAEDDDGNPMTVFDWMPMKWVTSKEGDYLVSEWEGKYTDRAGFLKEDILGLETLDKLNNIIKIVRRDHNKDLVLTELPVDDPRTYEYFCKGWTEDIFQMNTSNFKQYSRRVKPDNIEDLIAMNALWRPGPMSSDAHTDFYKIKHGEKEAQYDYGLKEVTRNTHGLYVYQEQIMRAVHVLGNLSLVESDEVRTVMKKFDKVKMKLYRDKFIAGAIENGCNSNIAEAIWTKLDKFSGYGFNRSHSAAYALMTYWTQYLKVHYPIEFWTTSLQFAKDEDEITNRISEMRMASKIEIKPPNVNKSTMTFVGNKKNNSIYWSLLQISGLAIKGVTKILAERDAKGEFTNITNFTTRMKGTGVGRDKLRNLILAGAFDECYKVQRYAYRKEIMKRYYEMFSEELPDNYKTQFSDEEDFWILEQKKITGFGDVDFKRMLESVDKNMSKKFVTPAGLRKCDTYDEVTIAGQIMFVKVMKYKKKKGEFCILTLSCNHDIVIAICWYEVWKVYETRIRAAEKSGQVLAIAGKVNFDDYRQDKVLFTTDDTKIKFF